MKLPAHARVALAMLHDVAASGLAWVTAFWLRFNLDIPPAFAEAMVRTVFVVMAVQGLLFWFSGLYRGLWRYASLHDIRLIVLSVAVAALVAPAALVLAGLTAELPRSVFILQPVLLLLIMGGSRMAYRAWKEGRLVSLASIGGEPVFILGAGAAADKLIRELAPSPQWRLVGLLDDDRAKQGRSLHGIPVLGALHEVADLAAQRAVTHVIVAMPGVSHNVRRRAVKLASDAGLKVMTVPSFDDIASGRVRLGQLRSVELDDLLGRDPVVLDDSGLKSLLEGRVVMVTGAGGSIGSELCRQAARFRPDRLVLLDSSEAALYTIEQEFEHSVVAAIPLVGDVKDAARMAEILSRHRPDVVLHAAAYKHVPLMETGNAWQAVRNNVAGTLVVAEAAVAAGVAEFVLVSTDKAVNPVNVMGASKRLAEMVCQALQAGAPATRFVTVRFGNVLGSTGSVIPKFNEQIRRGGPVTVTHPEITRYFMSIPEAAQLVLQAALMGRGGEIFVLDMGEPVRIADLAHELIRLSGPSAADVRIEFPGLRPGEKLYEELLADGEATVSTPHPKLRIARAAGVDATWLARLRAWLDGAAAAGDGEVRTALQEWVPEYRPAAAGEQPRAKAPRGAGAA